MAGRRQLDGMSLSNSSAMLRSMCCFVALRDALQANFLERLQREVSQKEQELLDEALPQHFPAALRFPGYFPNQCTK